MNDFLMKLKKKGSIHDSLYRKFRSPAKKTHSVMDYLKFIR